MKTLFTYFFFQVILLPISALKADDSQAIELNATAIENLRLEFTSAIVQTVPRLIQASGTVKRNEKHVVEVTPRIPGIVITDPRSLGDSVKQGDDLCRIQSADLSEKIASYVSAEEAMMFAAAAAEQERKLQSKNLSSTEQLRAKEMELKQAVAAHAKALQPLKLLEFNEGTIHVYLANIDGSDYTTLDLKAPESGEIIEKDVVRGAAVEHDQSLFTIADLSELWVDFYVSLRDISEVQTGGEVRVDSSVSDLKRSAKIIYVSPVADDRSRAVLVRAVLDNKDGTWRPGTPVTVYLTEGSDVKATTVAVPNSAIVDYDGGKAVFVKMGDATFLPVKVEIGSSNETMTGITSGLKAGQHVVSRNAAQLKGHLEMTSGE